MLFKFTSVRTDGALFFTSALEAASAWVNPEDTLTVVTEEGKPLR